MKERERQDEVEKHGKGKTEYVVSIEKSFDRLRPKLHCVFCGLVT